MMILPTAMPMAVMKELTSSTPTGWFMKREPPTNTAR